MSTSAEPTTFKSISISTIPRPKRVEPQPVTEQSADMNEEDEEMLEQLVDEAYSEIEPGTDCKCLKREDGKWHPAVVVRVIDAAEDEDDTPEEDTDDDEDEQDKGRKTTTTSKHRGSKAKSAKGLNSRQKRKADRQALEAEHEDTNGTADSEEDPRTRLRYVVRFTGSKKEQEVERHMLKLPLDEYDEEQAALAAVEEKKNGSSTGAKPRDTTATVESAISGDLSPRTRQFLRTLNDMERKDRKLADFICAMCERVMPLTFHHLIPRVTHAHYLRRGVSKEKLNQGIDICRPCHSAIHRLYSNETLGRDFNTLALLLRDARVQKWLSYARKQPARNLDFGHNAKEFRYRR